MRIGLTGGGSTVDMIVEQARRAESDGFHALWYAGSVAGDPVVATAIAGRATTSLELGTAVLQTYPCRPLLQANRVAAAANAMGRPGLTLGLGPSHRPEVRRLTSHKEVGHVVVEATTGGPIRVVHADNDNKVSGVRATAK